jgi:hypothetical protein
MICHISLTSKEEKEHRKYHYAGRPASLEFVLSSTIMKF